MNKVMVKCSCGSDLAVLLAVFWLQKISSRKKLLKNILGTSPFRLEFVDDISKDDLWFRIWIVAFMSSVPVVADAL